MYKSKKKGNHTTLQKKKGKTNSMYHIHVTGMVKCSVAEYNDFMIYHRN